MKKSVCRRNIVFFLLISSITHSCFSSEALVKDTVSDTSLKANASKDAAGFLFTYFGLTPKFKKAPKDVQYLISRRCKDLFIVPFFVKEPLKTVVKKEDTMLEFLVASPDDTHVACTGNNSCTIIQLNLDGEGDTAPLVCVDNITIEDKNSNSFERAVFNKDGTKLAILSWNSVDEVYLEKYKVLSKTKLIDMEKLLYPEGKPDLRITCGRYGLHKAENKLLSLGYTPSDELVLASSFNQIFIISQDRKTIRVIEDPSNKFDYNRMVYNYFNSDHREKKILTKLPVDRNEVLLHTGTSTAFFYPVHGLVRCDYGEKSFTTLIEEDLCTAMRLYAISHDGKIIVFKRSSTSSDPVMPIFLYDVDSQKIRKLPTYNELCRFSIDVYFSPGLKFMLITGDGYSRIYHTRSLTCVAYINSYHDDKDPGNAYLKGCYSHNGKFFITAISFKENGNVSEGSYNDTIQLSVWKHDPQWDALENLYNGRLLLEQALLIVFLRSIASEKKSLATIAQEYDMTRESLTTYLTEVLNSIDNPALVSYIKYQIIRMPK